jgi:hypothetical protein
MLDSQSIGDQNRPVGVDDPPIHFFWASSLLDGGSGGRWLVAVRRTTRCDGLGVRLSVVWQQIRGQRVTRTRILESGSLMEPRILLLPD